MPKSIEPDRWLFGATLGLCLAGAVMIFSASAVTARELYGSSYTFLLRQTIWLGAGFLFMLALARVDYRILRRPAVVYAGMSVSLLLLAAVLVLDKAHATHRWIRLGPVSFQPAEFAKLAVIFYLAWFLELRAGPQGPGVNHPLRTLLPGFGPPLLIAALVLLEPDMGTAAELFLIALVMFFAAGLSWGYVAAAVTAAAPVIYLLIVSAPYRYQRLMAFLHPSSDPRGHSFQLLQSLIAVGSGGVFGVGLMEGRQKLFYLPEAHTDFIFAVIAEELGLIGGLAVLLLLGIYAWRGVRAAWLAEDGFGRLAALGITAMVAGQALINLSVVLGLVPTKGIPLPFVSYGGSSLMVMLLATGVLLNISQQTSGR
ncbi:MAG TPA: putative lipid II flippase FtsW [Candidatus Acidoferrales bacterium]|nr:putative lipid II flippase FtsW [Candidatus Acidoferrales bacterium]